jgi:hypothetical protein
LRLDVLIKTGAIFSSLGTALLIIIIMILLIFPVVKDCQDDKKCSFFSTAPRPLNYLVTPVLVSAALFIIATGVLIMRFARRYKYKI